MNKHFKVLRSKALELVQLDLETVERDHTVMYVEHLEMVNAKFAELIVEECIEQIKLTMARDGHGTEHYKQSSKHIEKIKKQFGIK
jgi:hypothetical protein